MIQSLLPAYTLGPMLKSILPLRAVRSGCPEVKKTNAWESSEISATTIVPFSAQHEGPEDPDGDGFGEFTDDDGGADEGQQEEDHDGNAWRSIFSNTRVYIITNSSNTRSMKRSMTISGFLQGFGSKHLVIKL